MVGEGTMSIAKAFLDAGASGIIASLWKVNDESVTKLSELFYKKLRKGGSVIIFFDLWKITPLKDLLEKHNVLR